MNERGDKPRGTETLRPTPKAPAEQPASPLAERYGDNFANAYAAAKEALREQAALVTALQEHARAGAPSDTEEDLANLSSTGAELLQAADRAWIFDALPDENPTALVAEREKLALWKRTIVEPSLAALASVDPAAFAQLNASSNGYMDLGEHLARQRKAYGIYTQELVDHVAGWWCGELSMLQALLRETSQRRHAAEQAANNADARAQAAASTLVNLRTTLNGIAKKAREYVPGMLGGNGKEVVTGIRALVSAFQETPTKKGAAAPGLRAETLANRTAISEEYAKQLSAEGEAERRTATLQAKNASDANEAQRLHKKLAAIRQELDAQAAKLLGGNSRETIVRIAALART